MKTFGCVTMLLLSIANSSSGGVAQKQTHAKHDEPTGIVTGLIPVVMVKRAGQESTMPLKISDPLYKSDVITSSDRGRLRIKLVDGSQVNIGPKSIVLVIDPDEYGSDIELQAGKLQADFKSGHFLLTPNAEIEIPGEGECVIQAEPKVTRIWSLKGDIRVNSLNPDSPGSPSVPVTTLHTGQFVRVPPDTSAPAPAKQKDQRPL